MKNKFDAYRIFTGRRFSRSLLSNMLIIVILTAVFTLLLTVRDILSVVTDTDLNFDDWRDVIAINSVMAALELMWFFGWSITYLKKLVNLDMSDKLSPGGKFFCTIPDSRRSYMSAHILSNAGTLITILTLSIISIVGLTLSGVYFWEAEPAEMLVSNIRDNTQWLGAFGFSPLIAANLCELISRTIPRIVAAAVAMPFASLSVTASAPDELVLPVLIICIVLFAASEYILMKKRDARIAGEPASA